jgi:hypothetical protein
MRERVRFESELHALGLREGSPGNDSRELEWRPGSPSTLPLLLAGPIVRRATPEAVWFWFACSKNVKDCKPSIIPYDDKGRNIYAQLSEKEVVLDASKSTLQVVRLGERIWIALVSAVPKTRKLPHDLVLGYDLSITTEENGAIKTTKLTNLDLKITYPPFPRPTFVIGKENRRLVHGSCRRPGAAGEDAFGVYDQALGKVASDALSRPASLILTGDQIYADDVATPLFEAVIKIAEDVFGYVEQMPNPDGNGLIPTDKYTWGNTPGNQIMAKPFIARGSWSTVALPRSTVKFSDRKRLTYNNVSPIGFTTEDGESHLLSFPEYASMYLAVWNPELCRLPSADVINPWYFLEYKQPNPLYKYPEYVQACRRVMANTATYMLFDDHDITDDWNLDKQWEEKTKKNPLARRIIANGLAAYWGFQAWGNAPEMFDKSFIQTLSLYFEQLRTSKGYPRNIGSRSPNNAADKYEEALLKKHWSFMAESNPKALCIDTRTSRDSSKDGHAILSGKSVQPYLKALLDKYGFRKNDILLLVTPTPFLPHQSMMTAQDLEYDFPEDRYEGDFEFYANYPKQRAELVYWLYSNFKPSAAVFLSGDVHHGSVITGRYGYGSSLEKIHDGKADWVMRIVQVTSSPIKNIKDTFVNPKLLLPGTDLGNIGESFLSRSEYQADMVPGGNLVMQAISRSMSGALGRETCIFENHFCVVEMPEKPKGPVKVLFIGVKNGAMQTAKITVDTDNDPAKLKFIKTPLVTLPPQNELARSL